MQDPADLSLTAAGPRAWHTIEHAYQQADRIAQEAVRNIPCRSCSGPEGLELVRGIHDVKNVELGKPVHDPQSFKHFEARVEAAAQKAGIDATPRLLLTKTRASQNTDGGDILIFAGIVGLIAFVGFLATRKPPS